MIDYLKTNMGTIFLSAIFLIVGVVLGLTIEEGNNGIYISANYPNGEKLILLGKNSINVSDLDIGQLNKPDSQVLALKIKDLSVDDLLSTKLREMAQESDGPFKSIPVTINLHLTNESTITGQVAKACKNTPVFKYPLLAYGAKDEENNDISIKGLLGLHVAREHFASCDANNGEIYDVWASKEYVEKWIDSNNLPESTISVEARIVVSSIVM